MHRRLVLLVVAAFLGAAATPAFAGVGFHGGLSLDPDDFLVGLRFRSSPLADHLHLVPKAEVGFGDVTMLAGNLDLQYYFQTKSNLEPYAGGGMTLNWFDFEGGSSTEVGGSLLGGIQLTKKLFFEAKFGLGDVPDVKLVVGWEAGL